MPSALANISSRAGSNFMIIFRNNDSIIHKGKLSKMTKKNQLVFLLSFMCISSSALSRYYEIPPTSTTSANVPWIPDIEMERCVKKYNEAKWLAEEIDKTEVNQYSQPSIDAYNYKITRHSQMTGYFNSNCAGKQSESAYRAAQKLNQ
jgi:hypothetical protein